MESLGNQLRIVRERLDISQRTVARKSAAIAQTLGSGLYRTTASWLSRIESNPRYQRKIRAHLLIALLSIYGITLEELLAVEETDDRSDKITHVSTDVSETLTITDSATDMPAHGTLLPDDADAVPIPEKSEILESKSSKTNGRYLRIVIGRTDNYLYPIVPAGSVALVDRFKHSINHEPENIEIEIQRPAYLLQFRDGKRICCLCEPVDGSSKLALIFRHPTGSGRSFQVHLGKDVDVIGQVILFRVPAIPKRQASNTVRLDSIKSA